MRNDGLVKVSGQMDEGELRHILRHPLGMFGTDAGVAYGGGGPASAAGLETLHPRAYGTYPRILGMLCANWGT